MVLELTQTLTEMNTTYLIGSKARPAHIGDTFITVFVQIV
jgi:hypothetical protein